MTEKHLTINGDCTVTTNSEAVASRLVADKMRINVRNKPGLNPYMDLEIADKLEDAANAHLMLAEMPERGAGGELTSADNPKVSPMLQAIKYPDRVTVDASLDRVELVHKNGVLNMALDAAESIGAKNAAEQMLAHQMATAHRMSLDLMIEAANTRDPVEKCRLVNASAKLMDVCQKAMLTVNRLHTGGQQVVTVQYVQVTDGGQAVINGSVDARGRGADKK